ncbi:MAG: 50S ribosomal protein L15 [uncultured bacterium]|nr:MAG: 50S ribosomal protein L15 [uncultured bacterium]HBR78820.1 50S ribosomal protein L15 [Candidatus Moranbacteria bacterium]
MQIHELKVKPKKNRKRIGRGGKRGTYSGKGNKGQKARSGGNVDPLFQGGSTSLIDRLKKIRGFKAIVAKKNILDLNTIEEKFEDNSIVSIETLLEKKIFRKSEIKNGVKILGDGELKKKITISKEISVSKSSAEAIKKAGGKIEEKPAKKKSKKELKLEELNK